MRIIHTSDWHLGQTLHQFDRSEEHQHFLDWLTAELSVQQADVLLIAGDVFDTANPSSASQKMFYRFLQKAKAAVPHLQIIVIAGNHDSPGRLEAALPLLEDLDTTVVGFVPRDAVGEIDLSRLVIPLKNRSGQIAAYALAIPFLRPSDVPRIENAQDAYMEGIALLYRQAIAYAQQLRSPDQAIIALGHCHMVGGEVSEDSERRIVIGGTEALSASMFDASVAYAALGHLHLAQQVGKQAHLRYCGSPLPLSFAEIHYQHQILRVDTDGNRVTDIVPLPVPRTVALLRIPDQAAPLAEVLQALRLLDLPAALPPERQPLLEVRVRLDAPEPGLRASIEAALDGKGVRLAKIETSFATRSGNSIAPDHVGSLDQLQPADMFERLYQSRYQSAPDTALRQAFNELLLEDGQ